LDLFGLPDALPVLLGDRLLQPGDLNSNFFFLFGKKQLFATK
jgi:hypothetical protein